MQQQRARSSWRIAGPSACCWRKRWQTTERDRCGGPQRCVTHMLGSVRRRLVKSYQEIYMLWHHLGRWRATHAEIAQTLRLGRWRAAHAEIAQTLNEMARYCDSHEEVVHGVLVRLNLLSRSLPPQAWTTSVPPWM